ncbi:phage minor structural protein [Brevibacillus brevis]|uniref:phage scaffolding protein n=1 Tax=Brevibacillus brevis TaxID=1393 RepID=UPI0019011692|nr:phage minor structural protein [Brevibacillus brevis]
MNKEQFIALGLSEELAEKAAAASQDELKSFIPKARFDEVNTAKKKAEDDLKERDKQLDDLKKSAGDSAALQEQITKLQGENKAAAEKYEAEAKELKLSTAIKLALSGEVHDPDIVAGLLDKSKIELDDNGAIKGGLDDQIKGLRESKAFLFAEKQTNQSFQFLGVNPADGKGDKGGGQPQAGDFGKRLAEFAKSNEGLDKARASYFE